MTSDRIDLWLLPPAHVDRITGGAAALSSQENDRFGRLIRPSSQRQYLASRVLLRHALSRYADRAPGDWQFDKEPHGRPRIIDPPGGLDFNLAHTQHLVVVAITRSLRVGVDVERSPAPVDLCSIREKVLTPSELAAITPLNELAIREQLIRHWVVKEAYTKAIGLGMRRGFHTFEVDLDGALPVLKDPLADRPWHLREYPVGDHLLALASPDRGLPIDLRTVNAVRVLRGRQLPDRPLPATPQSLRSACTPRER